MASDVKVKLVLFVDLIITASGSIVSQGKDYSPCHSCIVVWQLETIHGFIMHNF